jgi:hypothetical protein
MTFHESWQKELLKLHARLDRLWDGDAKVELSNVQVEIKKRRLQVQDLRVQHEIVDLERNECDLKELVKRSEDPSFRKQLDERKELRLHQIEHTVFEQFELLLEQDSLFRKKYDEWHKEISEDPTLSPETKSFKLKRLEKRFEDKFPKQKTDLDIYREEP